MSTNIDLKIAKALAKHLSAFTPTIGISWENTNYSPDNNTMYLEPWLMPLPSRVLTLGPEAWQEYRGLYQITVVAPSGKGWSEGKSKASDIVDYFTRGTSCTYDDIEIRVTESYLGPSFYSQDGSWYRTPVDVVYRIFCN